MILDAGRSSLGEVKEKVEFVQNEQPDEYPVHNEEHHSNLLIEFELVEVEDRVDEKQDEQQSEGAVLESVRADLNEVTIRAWLVGEVSGLDQPGDAEAEENVECTGAPGVAQRHGALALSCYYYAGYSFWYTHSSSNKRQPHD